MHKSQITAKGLTDDECIKMSRGGDLRNHSYVLEEISKDTSSRVRIVVA